MHGALLHQIKYESEIEVVGDGYRFVVLDPYNKCKVMARYPDSEETVEEKYETEDMYFREDKVFLNAVQNKTFEKNSIQSPYSDSFETYRFTQEIKKKSEQ